MTFSLPSVERLALGDTYISVLAPLSDTPPSTPTKGHGSRAPDAPKAFNPIDRSKDFSFREAREALILLGSGSFGDIMMNAASNIVFKTVREAGHADKLFDEFTLYSEAHGVMGNSQEAGGFWCPRSWLYYKPDEGGTGSKIILAGPSPPRPAFNPRPRSSRTSLPCMWDQFTHSTFILDLIPSIPPYIASRYQRLFYSDEILSQNPLPARLLRLYFGRDDFPDMTWSLPADSSLKSDPPLDLRRFTVLSEDLVHSEYSLPTVVEVSQGMGVLLAQLHWAVGINARDIELVLGLGPVIAQCYAFDFNQCQRWLRPAAIRSASHVPNDTPRPPLTIGMYAKNTLLEGATRLAKLIFGQELYYPRPHHVEPYTTFKASYLATVDALLENCTVNVDAKAGPAWDLLQTEVRAAAVGFFEEYERLDREKMARKMRMSKGT